MSFPSQAGALVDTLGPVQRGADLSDSLDRINVPETVESAITERLASLPDEVWPMIRLGAVIGRAFSFDLLREASEQPTDSLIKCSNTLVRRDIWEQTGDEIAFSHGLVREQTLDRLGDQERERLHTAAAAAIESLHGDKLDRYAGTLGHHYEHVGEYGTAIEYYQQAGDQASEAYAHDEAIEQYQRALTIAREHGKTSDATSTAIAMSLAGIHRQRGEYDSAEEYYERSPRKSEEIGDRDGMAQALDGLGIVMRNRDEYDRAQGYYERSLTLRQEIGDRSGEADSLHNLGNIAFFRGVYDQAEEYYKRSLEIKETIESANSELLAHCGLGALARQERYPEAEQHLDDALGVRGADDHKHNLARVHLEQARLALDCEDIQIAREAVEKAHSTFSELDATHFEARANLLRGRLAARTDSTDEARKHWRDALYTFEDIGAPQDVLKTLAHLVETCRQHGDTAQADGYETKAETIYERAPESVQEHHGEWLDC